MDEVDVSIIYVNWNCSGEMLKSIASVRRLATGCTREIIVVDNLSPEDISGLEQPDIHLIRNPVNGGFGSGCNVGAKAAKGKYLLFLNPDTLLLNDVPGILFGFLEKHPDAGACGAMLRDSDGAINYNGGRRRLGLVNEILEHSSLCFKYPRVPFIGRPYYGNWDHRSTRQVQCLCGACMMFRREVFFAEGGFDERFFMYCEEMDLCRRTLLAGRKIFYVHSAELMHENRKSTMQYYGTFHRFVMQYLDSTRIHFLKHYGRVYTRVWRWCIGGIYFLKYVRHRRKEDLEKARWGMSFV
ncbi:MAG: glycosyltransferase family 2 protein [Planctomycetota bacterium]|jgi:GT2 family glycosyltransferase|nr:glycosyltransferase family 2 protein [Planctomycetota bacterium]